MKIISLSLFFTLTLFAMPLFGRIKPSKGNSLKEIPWIIFNKEKDFKPQIIPQIELSESNFKGIPLIQIEKRNEKKFERLRVRERTVELKYISISPKRVQKSQNK